MITFVSYPFNGLVTFLVDLVSRPGTGGGGDNQVDDQAELQRGLGRAQDAVSSAVPAPIGAGTGRATARQGRDPSPGRAAQPPASAWRLDGAEGARDSEGVEGWTLAGRQRVGKPTRRRARAHNPARRSNQAGHKAGVAATIESAIQRNIRRNRIWNRISGRRDPGTRVAVWR